MLAILFITAIILSNSAKKYFREKYFENWLQAGGADYMSSVEKRSAFTAFLNKKEYLALADIKLNRKMNLLRFFRKLYMGYFGFGFISILVIIFFS
jgi:hypothetical protein